MPDNLWNAVRTFRVQGKLLCGACHVAGATSEQGEWRGPGEACIRNTSAPFMSHRHRGLPCPGSHVLNRPEP
jgi:hypothetical protein